MLSYNDRDSESSESDLDDDHIYKATTTYGKISKEPHRRQSYSSSEEEQDDSEEDSLGDQPQENGLVTGEKGMRKPIDKIAPIYQRGSDSEDSEQQNSIDHIEQRIKRLEMDLEKKIDKHKKESSVAVKDRPQTAMVDIKGKNLKNAASPPLPKKMQAKSGIISKVHPSAKPHKLPMEQNEQQGKMEAEGYLPPTNTDPKFIEQLIEKQREEKVPSPKKKLSKEKKEEQVRNPSLVVEKKRTGSKNPLKNEQPHNQYPSQGVQSAESGMAKKLSKATKQIEELSKALDESKKENKRLRQQLLSSKKKKPLQQVQKLKELTADSQDVKLEKEIQLLKIIEGLQAKLKKSINKKLGKSRVGSTSAALLHKGLPSSLMH